jgi:hypothetical protein
MRKVPQRPGAHVLETLSTRFFVNRLPASWTTTTPANDYGVDLIVGIFDGHNATNYELQVQLKASQHRSAGGNELVKLRIATYNHLRNLLHVVMLVKYIADENEAYWILLVDVPEPFQAQETFTVRIPRTNTLSTINWNEIEVYIREVVDNKLAAGDVVRNRRKNKEI